MSGLYVRHELLRSEAVRMATLNNSGYDLLERKLIVKSGFYLEPWHDRFTCFSCSLSINRLCQPLKLTYRHYRNSPDCAFLKNLDVSIRRIPYTSFKGKSDYENRAYFIRKVDAATMTQALMNTLTDRDYSKDYRRRGLKNQPLIFFETEIFIPSGGESRYGFDTEKFFLSMRAEHERLKTFYIRNYSFPVTDETLHLPELLARNGLFYTLTQSNVQCSTCRLVIGDGLSLGYQDYVGEHERLNRRCPWNRGHREHNIPRPPPIPRALIVPPPPGHPIDITDGEADDDCIIIDDPIQAPNASASDVSSSSGSNDNVITCRICFENKIKTVYSCGHISHCDECSRNLVECPICKQRLHSPRKIYFP